MSLHAVLSFKERLYKERLVDSRIIKNKPSSGGFNMGSMGSAEPINYRRMVLEPINF